MDVDFYKETYTCVCIACHKVVFMSNGLLCNVPNQLSSVTIALLIGTYSDFLYKRNSVDAMRDHRCRNNAAIPSGEAIQDMLDRSSGTAPQVFGRIVVHFGIICAQ